MKLAGAYYPDLLKVADFQTQISVGCDPEILRFFSDHFIADGHREDMALVIYEAEESVWKETQKTWGKSLQKRREFSPDLH